LSSISKTLQFTNTSSNLIPNFENNLWDSEKFSNITTSQFAKNFFQTLNPSLLTKYKITDFQNLFKNSQTLSATTPLSATASSLS